MILPCRIHQPRNRVDPLPLALLFAACLLASVTEAIGQYAAGVPLEITAGVNVGYDDNVLGSAATSASGQTSFLTTENVVLSYNRPMEQTELHLLAVGRFAQYFDLGTDDKSGNITLSLTHNFSTRLSFAAYVYATYQTEPDFGGNVGLENVRADHYFTMDILSVTYHWLPRFTTVTSYTFQRVKYVGGASSAGAFQDRFQNTLSERFLFSLTRRTSLIGEYRFEIADYDTAPRDSVTHYVLAGVGHYLTQHLAVYVLGGESFRSFKNDGDTVDPQILGWLAYESSNHTLSWTTSYGVEEPSATAALTRTTIRTGLHLTYRLTSRINAAAGIYYHHDENEGPTATSSLGPQDSYDIALGLKYTINKRFVLGVDYTRSSVSALGTQPGYSRNRYYAGLTYTY